MQFLCLAYGSEADWKRLTKEQQDEYLAQDAVIRGKGAVMAALQGAVTTVSAPTGTAQTTGEAFAVSRVPLAGFSILEAASLDEAVKLVAGTPCSRAGGAIEIRPLGASNLQGSTAV